MAKVIAIALPKGGVGKTTTAVNLAASLASTNHRTLLIDMDTAGAAGLSLGFTRGNTHLGLFDVFNFTVGLKSAIHKTELPHLDVVPANVNTLLREERMLRVADNRAILKLVLSSVRDAYDYVIVDCPPFLRGLTTNALSAADSFILPVKAGQLSLEAVEKFMKYVEWIREVANRELQFEGVLLTMFTPGTRASEMTLDELESKYDGKMFHTTIPENIQLTESTFFGKPVLLHSPSSSGALAYLALAKELLAARPEHLRLPHRVTSLAQVGRA